MLVAPDGGLVPDERLPYFTPPAWAVDPMAPPEKKVTRNSESKARDRRLNGRYIVTEAIRHTNRGGIYRALDTENDVKVIIKQARPHVDVSQDGDAQVLLRNEAAVLARLREAGISARLIDQFFVGEDIFIVQEELRGETLDDWVLRNALRGRSLNPADVLACCHNLVELVSRIHDEGVAIMDFTPSNIIRSDDGKLLLVDLEAAAPIGEAASALATRSYKAPELGDHKGMPAANTYADLYSLGAIICFLVLEQEPYLPPDGGSGRSDAERLHMWLSVAVREGMALAGKLAPLILGLMDPDPKERWDLEQASHFLRSGYEIHRRGGDLSPENEDLDIIPGTLFHLIAEQKSNAVEMWPSGATGRGLIPASVMYGASGVAATLLRAHKSGTAATGVKHDLLAQAVVRANRWFDFRFARLGQRVLPGLYVGHAGFAWAAFDLATAVGDEVNKHRAIELAKSLPVNWHNPDVFHGLAGAGLTLLHLWQATGDEELGRNARSCADAILDAAIVREHVYWPLPTGPTTTHGPTSKSMIYQGFAHGTAGVGSFLLLSAQVWGDSRYLEFAMKAGAGLAANATVESDWNGRALESSWWDVDPMKPGERYASWCQGSAGIGGFFLRLWQHSGEAAYRVLAEQAGAAVRMSARHSGGGICHGLAGAGHFLLDLADALQEPRYRKWSHDVADWLTARHSRVDHMPIAGIEPLGRDTKSLDFASGSAGDLDFLLRLRFGGGAPWMPVLDGEPPTASDALG